MPTKWKNHALKALDPIVAHALLVYSNTSQAKSPKGPRKREVAFFSSSYS